MKKLSIFLSFLFVPCLIQGMDDRTPSPEPGQQQNPYERLAQAEAIYAAAWPNFRAQWQAYTNIVARPSERTANYKKLPIKKLITLKSEATQDLAALREQSDVFSVSLRNLISLANAAQKMRAVHDLRERAPSFAYNIQVFEKKLQDVDETIDFLELSTQVPTLKYRSFGGVSQALKIINGQKNTLQSTLADPVKLVLTASFLKGDPESPLTRFFVGQVQKYKNACIDNHSHSNQLFFAQGLGIDPRTIDDSNSIEGPIDSELLRTVDACDVAIDLLTKKPEPIVALTDESEATSSNIQSVRAKRPRNPRYRMDGWAMVEVSGSDSDSDSDEEEQQS